MLKPLAQLDALLGKIPGYPGGNNSDDSLPSTDESSEEHWLSMEDDTGDDVSSLANGIPDLADLIAPDGIDRSGLDTLKLGNYYVRSLFVTALPRQVDVGWLDPFLRMPADLDLSIHIAPLRQKEAIQVITTLITRLEAEFSAGTRSIGRKQDLKQSIQDAVNVRDLLSRGVSRLYRVSVGTNLFASSPNELNQIQKALENELAGRMIHARVAEGRMDEGVTAAGPLGVNPMDDVYRTLDSYAVSTIFPFTQSELVHDNGYPLARNYQTKNPIFYDPWDDSLDNRNLVLYGTSGAGKSSLIRMKVSRAAAHGEHHVILDPEGEYRAMTSALGGTYFRVGDPEYCFNPLDIAHDDEEGRVNLPAKIRDVSSLIQQMVGGLTPAEISILEDAIGDEYEERGITEAPESLLNEPTMAASQQAFQQQGNIKAMPTLSDLWQRLNDEPYQSALGRSTLLQALKRYRRDGALGFFDGQSTVDLSHSRIVDIDLSQLEATEARPIGMSVILGWVWDNFVKKHADRRKRVIIDEAWMLADDMMDFLETMVRRCRKRQAGIDIISQDYDRMSGHPKLEAIHTNSDTFVLMRHKESRGIHQLADAFNLSDGEKSFLLNVRRGEGILRVGGQRLAFHAEPTELEKGWVFADPGASLPEVNVMRQEQSETTGGRMGNNPFATQGG